MRVVTIQDSDIGIHAKESRLSINVGLHFCFREIVGNAIGDSGDVNW